jgi:2-keto-4-pentenoate hydratase
MTLLRTVLLTAGTAALLAACASAPPDPPTCPSDADVAANVQRYLALQPVPNPPATLTMEGARCGAGKFVAQLGASQGKVVGYKAGLTNPAVQKRFNYDQPLRGTLFEKMILKEGVVVPSQFGARPFAEADLVVEVGSAAVHDARTPQEVLGSLRAVYPFIELPDLLVQDPAKVTGAAIQLNNVGARLGVLGTPVPVRNDPAFAEALRTMTVRGVDVGSGKEHGTAPGSAILGHPLNAVIWLAADLKRAGITLKPGDLLSLGSFSPALPVTAGSTLKVSYEGLPGNPSVQVSFR